MRKLYRSILRTWRQWRLTVFLVVFVVLPVKSSLADLNWVPTGSMKPTILEGDFLLINKLAYDLRLPFTLKRLAHWADPARGDIVICFSPDDGTRLVKRVIGLPGDTVAMVDDRLILNGTAVPLSGLDATALRDLDAALRNRSRFATERLDDRSHAIMAIPGIPARRTFAPRSLGEGEYFVMGDNRDRSRDSRFFGPVPRRSIVGRAVGIVGSFNTTDKLQPRPARFGRPLE